MISIRTATFADAVAITAIYNDGIAGRAATFETAPRIPDDLMQRIGDRDRHPLLVATDTDGEVLGWAGLGSYRERACYAGIAEFSVYLSAHARGRGVGRQLLGALVDAARERGHWKLVSRIFLFNAASRALCRSLGFREVGVYEKHGRLDGRWLDVVIVERLITENIRDSQPAAAATAVPEGVVQ